ncbi:alpha/beta hydrolase [Patescibacteria group bacterium]|nr:alpha/beta hydrolase [Patescibacteria group bacterium]
MGFVRFFLMSQENGKHRAVRVMTLPGGRRLGFAEYGDPKGKPLFYFHGWPSSRLSGEKYDVLGKKLRLRIVSPDRPGFGLSDYQEGRTLMSWPEDISVLADVLKIQKFSVLGVSGGGPYAAATAYKLPKRVVKAGIVVGLAPTWLPHILDGMFPAFIFGWILYRTVPWTSLPASIGAKLQTQFGSVLNMHHLLFGAKSDKKLLDDPRVQAVLRRDTLEAFRSGFRGPARDLVLYTHDWGFDPNDIRVPTNLWYGDDDKNVSILMGKYYAKKIQGSKLTVYPGEGHLISRTHANDILKTFVSWYERPD